MHGRRSPHRGRSDRGAIPAQAVVPLGGSLESRATVTYDEPASAIGVPPCFVRRVPNPRTTACKIGIPRRPARFPAGGTRAYADRGTCRGGRGLAVSLTCVGICRASARDRLRACGRRLPAGAGSGSHRATPTARSAAGSQRAPPRRGCRRRSAGRHVPRRPGVCAAPTPVCYPGRRSVRRQRQGPVNVASEIHQFRLYGLPGWTADAHHRPHRPPHGVLAGC